MSNFISFINHLYRNYEKKCNTGNTLGCIFVFKGDAKIAYLDDIANLEILSFQVSCHLLKLSKMLMGNICKWMLVTR